MRAGPRKQAKLEGKCRYFTGVPCKNGHIAERFVSTSQCCVCSNELKKQWNRKNAEHNKIVRAEYVKNNPTYLRNYYRRRYERDPASYYFYSKLRKKDVKLRTPEWANKELIYDFYRVAKELRKKGIDAVVDHIIPLNGELVSGLHVHNNLRFLTGRENNVKSNRYEVNSYGI